MPVIYIPPQHKTDQAQQKVLIHFILVKMHDYVSYSIRQMERDYKMKTKNTPSLSSAHILSRDRFFVECVVGEESWPQPGKHKQVGSTQKRERKLHG